MTPGAFRCQSILIWRLGVLFEWSREWKWNLHVNGNPSGKCSVSLQSTLKWFGSKTGGVTAWEQHPYWPTGTSDVWRLPHHFLLHVVQHPEAKRICTALGGLNNDETPNASMKQNTMPRKMKKEIWYVICVPKRVCVLKDGMKCMFHLGLQHATVNAANQSCSSFEVCLAQECKFQGWNGLSWRTELILCFPFCVWNLCCRYHLIERNRPLEWSHIERDWKPQTWCWKCPRTPYRMSHH